MEFINGLPKNRFETRQYFLTDDILFQPWTAEHRRWACYRNYGVACCVEGCHRIGTEVIHWYDAATFKKYGDRGLGEHIDLIGYDPDGTPFLMTVDHIIPKKYGAPKVWWNLQPMCYSHNFNQKAKMIHKPHRDRLETIIEWAQIPVNDSVVTVKSGILKQFKYGELYKIIMNHYKKEPLNC
jgi:hypothetical protein